MPLIFRTADPYRILSREDGIKYQEKQDVYAGVPGAAPDRWASDADVGAGFSEEPPFWPSRVRLTVPDLNHWTSTTARCAAAYAS
jgi:hypothetical protein